MPDARNHRLKSVPHQGPTLPKKPSIEKTIKDLREEIQRHEDLYYLQDNPEISDREYDALIDKLRQLEEQNPKFISPDSPTQRVGGRPAEGFPEFFHRRPMLSLDNSYNLDELRAFDEDRKSTRLNSSHSSISYAVFCLKKKKSRI